MSIFHCSQGRRTGSTIIAGCPTRAVCADYSQGNEAVFGENAGKQCVAMLATSIIYHHPEDISLWTTSTLNDILVVEITCTVL